MSFRAQLCANTSRHDLRIDFAPLDVPFPDILSAVFDHDIQIAININHGHMNRTVLSTFKSEICMGVTSSETMKVQPANKFGQYGVTNT
jgi:hypothetical protein